MVILAILGIMAWNIGFFSGLEYGVFEAWMMAAPGIAGVILALAQIGKDIDRLKSENNVDTCRPSSRKAIH